MTDFEKTAAAFDTPEIRKILGHVVAGSLVGGGVSGALASRRRLPGETRAQRRKRIVRDALGGAVLLGGAAGAVPYGLGQLGSAVDVEGGGVAEKLVSRHPRMGWLTGGVGLAAGTATDSTIHGIKLKDLMDGAGSSIRDEANTLSKGVHNATTQAKADELLAHLGVLDTAASRSQAMSSRWYVSNLKGKPFERVLRRLRGTPGSTTAREALVAALRAGGAKPAAMAEVGLARSPTLRRAALTALKRNKYATIGAAVAASAPTAYRKLTGLTAE